jgi:hypothetical protein
MKEKPEKIEQGIPNLSKQEYGMKIDRMKQSTMLFLAFLQSHKIALQQHFL